MTDYYQILGVPRTATDDDIKKAFRRLAMKHHPDRGGDERKFKEINEAYDTLGDADKRQQYDNPHVRINVNGNPFHGSGGPFNFDTIFEMFGARMHPRGQQASRNQRISIWISLETAVIGGPRTVSMHTQMGTQALEITIPPGINDNENVRYPGLGAGGHDLIVNYRVHGDPTWQRDGQDLYTERGVDFWQLITGASLEITDIQGRTLSLTIPPRTRPGTMLRARGRGVTREGHAPGDLIVRLRAEMPNDIPKEILDILEKQANK
jgi:curved DNA-binding protein